MAVNFIRIRSPMICPLLPSLWNAYMQVSRHNSENKDKLEKFLNNLTREKLKLKVRESNPQDKNNYHIEVVSNYDEELLLSNMINQNPKMTRAKWINLRNTCLEHLACGEGGMKFYEKFINLLHTYDTNYYEENEQFLKLLKDHVLWRQNMSDIDVIINSFSNSYQPNSVNEESLMYQRKVITQILDDVLNKHGSSSVVKLRKSFETICEKCHDYELLWILWTKLFESFWFSDQNTSDEIIEQHEEVRTLLASRSKQQCFRYFQKGNTELVNKIIQIFLRHNMRSNAIDVIKIYLAYEIWNKNSKAATEIVNFCIQLNIPLTDSENEKFVNLLLGRSPSKQQHDVKKKKIDIKKYNFKF